MGLKLEVLEHFDPSGEEIVYRLTPHGINSTPTAKW